MTNIIQSKIKQIIKSILNQVFKRKSAVAQIQDDSLKKSLLAFREIQTQVEAGNYRPVFIDEEGIWFKTGFNFFVFSNLKDRILELEKNAYWESVETNFVLDNLSSESVFVDVGANIGYFSLAVASQHDRAKIYAIEPVNSTYEMLCRNLKFNQYEERIIPLNVALGDHQGFVEMIDDRGPKNHISSNLSASQKRSQQKVKLTTLDDLIEDLNLKQIDLIKVDIEGYESYFIEGAKQTLSQLPLLLIEIQQKRSQVFGKQAIETMKSLIELGYHYLVISKKEKKIVDIANPEKALLEGNDFIFYHPSKHQL